MSSLTLKSSMRWQAGELPPAAPVQAIMQREARLDASGGSATAIRTVWHVPGGKGMEPGSILVLGGQSADQPDMLHLVPLKPCKDKKACFNYPLPGLWRHCCVGRKHIFAPQLLCSRCGKLLLLPSQEQEQEQHPLPWFGALQGLALVPPEHSLDAHSAPAALIALNEGGQLIVHDMHTLKPLPLFLPLQELPPVTASAFVAHQASAAPEVQPIPAIRHHLLTIHLNKRLHKV